MNSGRVSRVALMEKAVLKGLLPLVAAGQDSKSPLLMLGRVSAVCFSHKTAKERKPKCTVCGTVYDNYLLFVFHLELMHQGEIEVSKYEFSQDLLVIYYKEPGKLFLSSTKPPFSTQKYLKTHSKNYFLHVNYGQRAGEILTAITAKFTKKYVKQRKQYYHSYDIFKEITPQSENEDSEDDPAYIERELEKLRIGDFTDITEQDKLFFITWNKAVHQARKAHLTIGPEELQEVLTAFAINAKRLGMKRLNLVMHGWTLWSTGAINADDVSKFLQVYDTHE